MSESLDHDQVRARLECSFSGPSPTVPYRRLCHDDRAIDGDLFVAIRGARHDGHQSIPGLAACGVRGVIGEQPPPAGCGLPYYRVGSSRRALALMAHAFAGDPAGTLEIHAITGTNGKSTTVRLLAAILEAAGHRAGWMSTVTCRLGAEERPQLLTTPEPTELARGMTELRDHGGTHLVLEVSSHALMQERVSGIELAGGVLTNVTRDHLDYHGSHAAYVAAKRRLFTHLRPGAPAVVPHDGPVPTGVDELRRARVLTFGRHPRADARASAVDLTGAGTRGTLRVLGEELEFESRLLGRHNLENILAAVLVARAAGVPGDAISRGLAAAPPVRGRLEQVLCRPGRVYVDYAHTPEALAAVLRAVREITPGRLRVLFGCGGDRDRGKRPEMGHIAERIADVVYVTSDNPRGEEPARIVADVLEGITALQPVRVEVDRRRAIQRALSELEVGDTLVVAGKGHEAEQLVGEERHPFDDRQVILELAERGAER